MMPGRRASDDLFGMLAALGSLLIIVFMAWATVIFAAAASWSLFVYFLRIMGAAFRLMGAA
jgi:hypothetical protein